MYIMKKISNLFLILFMSACYFSCESEEEIIVNGEIQNLTTETLNKDAETSEEGMEQVMSILNMADQKLSELSDEAYKEIADPLRQELSEGELYSVEFVPIEDLFYLYEGIINYQHIDFYNEEYAMTEEDLVNGDQKLQSFDFEFQVEIEPNNTSFSITTSNFNALYNSINQTINQTRTSAKVTNVLSSNLSLNQINSTIASVSLQVTTGLNATHKPNGPRAVFTPPSTVYGAFDLGYCVINGPLVDASDFIGLYANDHISNPTIYNSRPRAYYLFKDLSPGPNFNISHLKFFGSTTVGRTYVGYETPFIWKDVVNSCVGDAVNSVNNTAIWAGLFADMDQIVDIPLQYLITNVDSRYKFMYTRSGSWRGSTYFPSDYFHYYSLTYGIKIP